MLGYVVHYRTGHSVGTEVEHASSTSYDITDLTIDATYTISVEATSQQLSGESEEMTITLVLSEFYYALNLVTYSKIVEFSTTPHVHIMHMHVQDCV